MKQRIQFIDQNGTFKLENCDLYRTLYFPLVNPLGMKSSITPSLNGDNKTDQNHFSLLPVSEEELNNSLYGRNVWLTVNNEFHWALSGMSPYQHLYPDQVTVTGGLLFHEVLRENNLFTTLTKSCVVSDQHIELHQLTITNKSNEKIYIRPIVAIPLFSRSADNLRDHRHVTSLLNCAKILNNGIINKPTLSFDERGHQVNDTVYGVFASSKKSKITNYWPTIKEFVGSSNLLYPEAVVKKLNSCHHINDEIAGYEVLAGLEFSEITLNPRESSDIRFCIIIGSNQEKIEKIANYSLDNFEDEYEKTKIYWQNYLSKLSFKLVNEDFSNWTKWVNLQVVLRRIYGCSHLPHHDYGRGGRGWRDLWQDQLALILMNDENVASALFNNFAGVRIDGSNATIIGEKNGQFLADRNQIVRVWSDHGAWGLFTTKLYLDMNGDMDFLLKNQTYFKDQFSHYTRKTNPYLTHHNYLLDKDGEIYQGTILEHLIIQNVIPFYNVGKHNNILIMDADWNDGLDMATNHGETIAFTAFYAHNLMILADILEKLYHENVKEIYLLAELKTLLRVDFEIVNKNEILNHYFDEVKNEVSGNKLSYKTQMLAQMFKMMASSIKNHLRQNEWLEDGEEGWYNGYYDDDGKRIDNISKKHLELTGQVFTVLSKISTPKQIEKQINACNKYLFDDNIGGYRLNTNFNELKTNMGRMFGFAYGNKENGSMFCHMAMMFAYGLYQSGYITAGKRIIDNIFNQVMNTHISAIYPGIPEYFNNNGEGKYHYLTGSASWLILTLVCEVFGVKGYYGDIVLEPKLLVDQFINQEAIIYKQIGEFLVKITYKNPENLNYDNYSIREVFVDGKMVKFEVFNKGVILKTKPNATIDIILSKR